MPVPKLLARGRGMPLPYIRAATQSPPRNDKKDAKGRALIRQHSLQNQSFSPILQKIAMAGASLATAIFLVLKQKSLILKCFAVLPLELYAITRNRHAEILCVFQEDILKLQRKWLRQNRMMSYESAPKP